MKLKKNVKTWCWVNFKYEGVPIFCFICELIGHNEKFCGRLFDTPLDQIERPYGAWMRAEPRRNSDCTIGAKWLRQSGSSFSTETMGAGGNKNGGMTEGMDVQKSANHGEDNNNKELENRNLFH